MSTENERDSLNSDPIPGSSFVQVAHSLEKESNSSAASEAMSTDPPLHIDEGEGGSVKSELSHPVDDDVDQGILITSGVQEQGQLESSLAGNEVSVQSLNTFDVQAMEEMMNAAAVTSERNRNSFRRIITSMSFAFLLICSYLGYALHEATAREQDLKSKVDLLSRENQRLEFENKMNGSSNMSPLFEFDSCYFNFKASASLGECAEELTRNAYEWYDWGVDSLYSMREEFFEQRDGDVDGVETAKGNDIGNIFDDLFENLSSFFVPAGDTEWKFDLDMDE